MAKRKPPRQDRRESLSRTSQMPGAEFLSWKAGSGERKGYAPLRDSGGGGTLLANAPRHRSLRTGTQEAQGRKERGLCRAVGAWE